MTFEREVYRGVFEASENTIQRVLDQLLAESLNFGTKFIIEVESIGIKQIWFAYIPDGTGKKERRNYGFIELNPLKISDDQPVEIRIVCCFEPLLLFWENVAHSLRVNHLLGDMKPDSPFSESHLPLSAVLTTYNPIKPESAHFAYPKEKREEIVRNYREARLVGEIENKDAWARAYYGITGRTLLKYETEFPEES